MVTIGTEGIHDEADVRSEKKPLPGMYHAWVKSAQEKVLNGKEKVIVEFGIFAGTTPGQEGTTLTEFFSITPASAARLQKLALVLGLVRPNEKPRAVDFGEGVDRQLIIDVVENSYTNKDGQKVDTVRIEFLGLYSLGNPEVKDVPRNQKAIKEGVQAVLAGDDDGFGAGQPVGDASQPAGGGTQDDSWSDI